MDGPSDERRCEEAKEVHGTSTMTSKRGGVIRNLLGAMRCCLMGVERNEHLLKKLAAKHNYNWSMQLALEMKHDFRAEFADEDTLDKRHALLCKPNVRNRRDGGGRR